MYDEFNWVIFSQRKKKRSKQTTKCVPSNMWFINVVAEFFILAACFNSIYGFKRDLTRAIRNHFIWMDSLRKKKKTNRRVFILGKCVLELKLVSQMWVAIHRATKCVHFIVKISIETDTYWHTYSFNRKSCVTSKLHTNPNHVIHRRYTFCHRRHRISGV